MTAGEQMTQHITNTVPSPSAAVGRHAQPAKPNDALMDACIQFEGLFVAQLLKKMRDAIPEGGMIPRGRGERLFQEMLDNEYATQISRRSSFGLASIMYRQLSTASPSSTGVEPASHRRLIGQG